MPAYSNQNVGINSDSPFKPGKNPFAPNTSGNTGLQGLSAPQAGASPLAQDVSGIVEQPGQSVEPQSSIDELLRRQPSPRMPERRRSNVGNINKLTDVTRNLMAEGQPLLDQILAEMQRRDTTLLDELLALQDELANAQREARPRSGGFFYRGY